MVKGMEASIILGIQSKYSDVVDLKEVQKYFPFEFTEYRKKNQDENQWKRIEKEKIRYERKVRQRGSFELTVIGFLEELKKHKKGLVQLKKLGYSIYLTLSIFGKADTVRIYISQKLIKELIEVNIEFDLWTSSAKSLSLSRLNRRKNITKDEKRFIKEIYLKDISTCQVIYKENKEFGVILKEYLFQYDQSKEKGQKINMLLNQIDSLIESEKESRGGVLLLNSYHASWREWIPLNRSFLKNLSRDEISLEVSTFFGGWV